MSGKNGVLVMINGKENRMPLSALVQMLQGMNSSNIEKIELITTPPASFSAEGDAGIINIVLIKNTGDGFNSNASLNVGYARKEKTGLNLNFNYRKNKLNWYGDYSFLRNHMLQDFDNYRRVVQDGTVVEVSSNSDRDAFQVNHNARLGLDVDLSDKTILGFLVSGFDQKWSMDAVNEVPTLENGEQATYLRVINDEVNQLQNIRGNFNVQHNFEKDEQISFNADYLVYDNNNPTNYLNQYFDVDNGNLLSEDRVRSGKITPLDISVGKLDYKKNLNEDIKMEAGLKASINRFDNEVSVSYLENGIWGFDPELTQTYDLEEDILAAYTSWTFQFSETTSLMAGLRYEQTRSLLNSLEKSGIVDRNYGELFPTVFFAHDINENNRIQFSYNRRISRPTFRDLAPFVIFLDPSTFYTGNSAIQPALTNSGKFDYRWKTILASIQYNNSQSFIARFQPVVDLEENRQLVTAANLDKVQSVVFSLSLPWEPFSWWNIQNSLTAMWTEVDSEYSGGQINEEQVSWSGNSAHNFTLPKDFSTEVSLNYRSANIWGISSFGEMWSLNFGIQKKFGNDWGNLRFSVRDIFNKSSSWRTEADQPDLGIFVRSTYQINWRTFDLTYSRSFGNNKVKGTRKRQTGSEADQRRAN
ncbi:MAG: TonB-dependent receptor [Saprospiraceae bacterium]|nr:TonB-dependent receptor [Saprospiraceae bacterium]